MPVDPRHGRDIPLGVNIARTLRAFLRQIGRTVREAIKQRRRINLSHFVTPMVEALLPLVRLFVQRGRLLTAGRLNRAIARLRAERQRERERKGLVLATIKAAPPIATVSPMFPMPGGVEIAFDVFLPQVELVVQRMTFAFVESTLATAAVDADVAYQQVRAHLQEGLSEGEALKKLNERIGQIFDDPIRAHRVAMTEASRAMHAGQMQAAQESGIVSGFRWLASSDACDRCLKLDGKEIAFGQAFYVDPKGGPYAVCNHPPLHPHCMCAAEEVLI